MSDAAQVRVIPPIIPATLLALGLAVHLVMPIRVGPATLVVGLGTALLALSVGILFLAVRDLKRAQTAFDVRKTTTQLVRTGVFGWSRNPVYLSMVLLCWAIGLLANSLGLLLVALPTASALCLLVIRREEAYLQGKFGPEYTEYCRRVRRWF
jgi:protein-S-isoprenylcysteine O-methyltransferase Ste14